MKICPLTFLCVWITRGPTWSSISRTSCWMACLSGVKSITERWAATVGVFKVLHAVASCCVTAGVIVVVRTDPGCTKQQNHPGTSRVWVPVVCQTAHSARTVSPRWWVTAEARWSCDWADVSLTFLWFLCLQATLCMRTSGSWKNTCRSSCTTSTTGSSMSAPSRSSAGPCSEPYYLLKRRRGRWNSAIN